MDEPALKATFEAVLTVDSDLTCLANMDIVSETDAGRGKKRVAFSKSPLMSTYIVAFVIGELVCIETDKFHVPIRIWTVPGKESTGKYSLDLTVKTLDFYEVTFGAPYPLPKLDSVAVANFGGGMENFGLIIYGESLLLLDEATASAADRFRVSEVVQHELAHQWFGNIVTFFWWNDLWLNEGFATWMSWYSCNVFFPEWKVWEAFIGDSQAKALR
jgi:aminopeptidase 2